MTDRPTAARWPGAATREISFYAQSLETEDPTLRKAGVDARQTGDWELVDSAWRWTGVLERVESGRWFSVSQMFDPDGEPRCWYVNFQRPPAWRADGWDTCDLALDLFADTAPRRWQPDPAWPTPTLARQPRL